MGEKHPSRWFRFSLRTLLVLVTALCCWLGWQLSVVRERQALRHELNSKGVFHFTTAEEWAARFPPGVAPPVQQPIATISLPRRFLGDVAIQEVWYFRYIQGFSETDLERVARVFPEAQITESLPEPCHPGCFPRGTLVDTPQARRSIEEIVPGELVTTFLPGQPWQSAQVLSVFMTDNWLWRIETEGGVLVTTETQPLCLASGATVQAGKLQPGEWILRRSRNETRPVRVLAVSPVKRREKVYNLILGDSEIFVASGFLARSKPPTESPID